MAGGGGTGRALLSLSFSSNISFSRSLLGFSSSISAAKPRRLSRVSLPPFPRPFSAAASTATVQDEQANPLRHSMLLERIRSRHLKDVSSTVATPATTPTAVQKRKGKAKVEGDREVETVGFGDLGLEEEAMGALGEMGISVPTEIQRIGIPAILKGKSVVLGSHTGSGKTLAYMLPIVQLLRKDEAVNGRSMKPRRPRAVVLCPTRELSEQVFHVAKSVSHHARFRSTMISGGGRLRPQEDSLNLPIDMVVGTPGRLLQHIQEGNMVYGDIKYLVLDEADTMFDRGFGPDIRKFLSPLKNRSSKPGDTGFQTVLVTATMTQAVQRLVDEEFFGITHLRTSSLHKKIASARHDFVKLSGSENKLEALLQVLEPSLAKGNRVMVFCNTLNSSRAVDHFLNENEIFTVNYHGEVPAEQRTENLKKFKNEDGDCPTLVCTDLAARGLDMDVDHVIMFDFPLNSIDYLHRTGRTARMGAKGKVTSLVTKKDLQLATRIEEAIRKNESLESLNSDKVAVKPRSIVPKVKPSNIVKVTAKKKKTGELSQSKSKSQKKVDQRKSLTTFRPKKGVSLSRPSRVSSSAGARSKQTQKKRVVGRKTASPGSGGPKLNVVGFRGRSSLNKTASTSS